MEEYSRVRTNINKDTFILGEDIELELSLGNPEYDKYRVHIGNFNEYLELIDSVNYTTYGGEGNMAKVNLKASQLGDNYIRGYMEDYKIESVTDSGSTTIGTLHNWFEVEYFVK